MSTVPIDPVSQGSSNASAAKARKPRVARRRGPVRTDDIDDEPIERAPLSDSESENSDEDTATEEEDEEDDPAPVTVAPDDGPAAELRNPPPLDATSTATPETSHPPSKDSSQLWSDSVALDKGGDDALPVIDFAEMSLVVNDEVTAEPTTEAKPPLPSDEKEASTPTAGTTEILKAELRPEKAGPPKPRPIPAHVTARQSYLKKLDSDPSFIPRLGQFWGHDDRLLDKDMRPMSDWWRGRWMNRGARGGRGGRGGFMGGRGRGAREGPPSSREDAPPLESRDPTEQKWAHDGYEEMLKEDSGPRHGRGFKGWQKEKRGGRGGAPGGRGASKSAVATQASPKSTEIQSRLQAEAAAKMASEQASTASPNTPTQGDLGTAPANPKPEPKRASRPPANPRAKLNAVLTQAAKDRTKASEKSVLTAAKNDVAVERAQASGAPEPASATDLSQPRVNLLKSPAKRRPPVLDGNADALATGDDLNPNPVPATPSARRPPVKGRAQTMETIILKDSFTKAGSASNPASEVAPSPATSQPPAVVNAPLVAQPASNPGYSYVNLPPGIAMGESGLLYEVATGRPVVLNASNATPPLPAPPIPIYDPRPVLHPHAARPASMSYIPPHVLSGLHPQTPPTPPQYGGPPGGPYSAGSPVLHEPQPTRGPPTFFTPPRSGARVQIRPPANGVKPGPDGGLKTSEAGQPGPQAPHPPRQNASFSAPDQYAGYGNAPPMQHAGPPPSINGSYPAQMDPYYGTTYYSTPSGSGPNGYPNQAEDPYYGGTTYYPQHSHSYGYPTGPVDYGYPSSQVPPGTNAPRNDSVSYPYENRPIADGQQSFGPGPAAQPQQVYY